MAIVGTVFENATYAHDLGAFVDSLEAHGGETIFEAEPRP